MAEDEKLNIWHELGAEALTRGEVNRLHDMTQHDGFKVLQKLCGSVETAQVRRYDCPTSDMATIIIARSIRIVTPKVAGLPELCKAAKEVADNPPQPKRPMPEQWQGNNN